MMKYFSVPFLFFVTWVVGPSEGKIWRAEELAVGQWDVTVRGGWLFDPSLIFPRSSIIGRKEEGSWKELVQRRRLWGSSMDCSLSLCPDGTFVLTPSATKKSRSKTTIQRRLALQGHWDVLSNPYCITDRFYDQLQLKSYSRRATTNTRTTSSSKNSNCSLSGRMYLSCRLWGRFSRSQTIGRKGCMTHGTLVWKDDTHKKVGIPRRIVASFSAKRVSNEPCHEYWEDKAFFGY